MTKETVLQSISENLTFLDNALFCEIEQTEQTAEFYPLGENYDITNGFSIFDNRLGDCLFLSYEKESKAESTGEIYNFNRTDYFVAYVFSEYNLDVIENAIFAAIVKIGAKNILSSKSTLNIIAKYFGQDEKNILERNPKLGLIRVSFQLTQTIPSKKCFNFTENMDCAITYPAAVCATTCDIYSGFEVATALQIGTHKIRFANNSGEWSETETVITTVGDPIIFKAQITEGVWRIQIVQPNNAIVPTKIKATQCNFLQPI